MQGKSLLGFWVKEDIVIIKITMNITMSPINIYLTLFW